MIDADIERAIVLALQPPLTAAGFNVIVTQGAQPTTQGATSQPQVTFTKILAKRFGFQGRKFAFNVGAANFTKTESWYLRATYQLNALIRQDAGDANSLNAYDVLDFCAGTLQTEETRIMLLETGTGIGLERVTDIRTPRSFDDSDRFNMDASFDFVLTYQNNIDSTVAEAAVSEILDTV